MNITALMGLLRLARVLRAMDVSGAGHPNPPGEGEPDPEADPFDALVAAVQALFDPKDGFLLYPRDLSNLYQDPDGTVQVDGATDPIGLFLESSKPLGTELITGTWASTSGCTVVANGETYVQTLAGDASGSFSINTLDTSNRFKVVAEIVSISNPAANASIQIGSGVDTGDTLGVGVHRFAVVPAGSGTVTFDSGTLAETGGEIVWKLSVRQADGEHLSQSNASYKPVLGNIPAGGVRNILTNSNAFDQSPWTNPSLAEWDAVEGAWKITSGAPGSYQLINVPGGDYVQSFKVKAEVGVQWQVGVSGNVTGGNVYLSGTGDGEWHHHEGTIYCNGNCYFMARHDLPAALSQFTIWIKDWQVELGDVATNPQVVGVSTIDVTEEGAEQLPFVYFDGSSKHLFNSTTQVTLDERVASLAAMIGAYTAQASLLMVAPTGSDASANNGLQMGLGTLVNSLWRNATVAPGYLPTWAVEEGTEPLDTPHVFTDVKLPALGTILVDGEVMGTDDSFSTIAATSGGGLALGARWNAGPVAPWFKGGLFGAAYLGGTPTDAEREAIEVLMSALGGDVQLLWQLSEAELLLMMFEAINGSMLGYEDLSGMFQDKNGITPVTSGGDPVGLVIDRSAPTTLIFHNTFDSDVEGWLEYSSSGGDGQPSWDAGRLKIDPITAYDGVSKEVTLVKDVYYRLTLDYEMGTLPKLYLKVRDHSSDEEVYLEEITTPTSGTIVRYFRAVDTDMEILLRSGGSSTGTCWFDNIKLEALGGRSGFQDTEAARPTYGYKPVVGRRNLLTVTDTLATQSVDVTNAEHTLSFKGTGTVTLSGASTAGPLVGTGAEDVVSLTFTPSAASLTLTVTGTVELAQLELGAARTNYQSVQSRFKITEAGQEVKRYLHFNGVDQYFQTSVNGGLFQDALEISVAIETPVAAAADTAPFTAVAFGEFDNSVYRGFALGYDSPNLSGDTLALVLDIGGSPGALGASGYTQGANEPVVLGCRLSTGGTKVWKDGVEEPLNLTYNRTTATNSSPTAFNYPPNNDLFLNAYKIQGTLYYGPECEHYGLVTTAGIPSDSQRASVFGWLASLSGVTLM